MLRFGISEYIRNFWFNLCIVMLLLILMMISTILVSDIDEQIGPYRLAEKYLDEDSMFLFDVLPEHMEELDTYGETLAVQLFFGGAADMGTGIKATVYTEEVMNYLKHRLDSGTYPKYVKSDDNTVRVLISHNSYGIKAGDTFTYEVYNIDGNKLQFQVYVAGVISEGQRMYTELHQVSLYMTYEDFFPIYSYEQTEQVRMIIPEEELRKIPEKDIFSIFYNIMINPSDDLSDEERTEIWKKIRNYEISSSSGHKTPYPKATELVERNDIRYKRILMRYLPLCIILVVLFSISIIGMVTIKTMKNMRYYEIMYNHGMQYRSAQLAAGMEMGFNCIIAFMATIVLLSLQKIFNVVGEINCNLDTVELLVMVVICVVTVVGSIFTTGGILKKHTSDIQKNTIL